MPKYTSFSLAVLSLFMAVFLTTWSGTGIVMGADISSNWAGYAMAGSDFSEVAGSWTVPPVEETDQKVSGNAEWIGIGGLASADLIQVGTETFAKKGGYIYYQAFYETLPKTATIISMKVHPGDQMTASIKETKEDVWLITLENVTTGETFVKTLNYHSNHSSAEWIEEMPMNSRSHDFFPLNDFGSVHFSDVKAIQNGNELDMINGQPIGLTLIHDSNILAEPTLLDQDSFDVRRIVS